jgi:C-terminal processing protease CtpA/Prc
VYASSGPAWNGTALGYEARLEVVSDEVWRQVLAEYWRSINSGFYDAGMHGADWSAVRTRYEALLSGVGTSEEMAFFVLSPMAGELNASHSEVSPKVSGTAPEVAEAGLTFDHAYAGPGLRVTGYLKDGPNDDAGPLVKPAEVVLKIDGTDVSWNERMWSSLAGRAGKVTEFLVSPDGKPTNTRTVKLTPIPSGRARELEYEEEVRRARDLVTKLSGGRLAYVRVLSMDPPSTRRFERELWSIAPDKEGLVLDVRENGGGSTHDVVLSQLARSPYGLARPRDGAQSTQPWRHWGRPTALLINENSASDAEILAMGFRKLRLGTIVGARTPGYVIGTYSAELQDGTSYRIPMWGWYTLDGQDIENVGVEPDIAVDNGLASCGDADDEQLKGAVSALLKGLPRR